MRIQERKRVYNIILDSRSLKVKQSLQIIFLGSRLDVDVEMNGKLVDKIGWERGELWGRHIRHLSNRSTEKQLFVARGWFRWSMLKTGGWAVVEMGQLDDGICIRRPMY